MSSGRADTRLAIIEATLRLLESGADKPLTFEEVAKAASVSRQGVYIHFANKAELLVAVVEHVKLTSGLDAALQRVREARTSDDALDAFFDAHAKFTPRLFASYRAVMLERLRDPEVERAWEARESSRAAHVRDLIDRFAEEGRLREGWTAAEAADFLWAITSPAATEDLMTRRGWSARKLDKKLRDVVFTTIVRKKGKKS